MGGQPVTGVALYEATLVMCRDWELIDVLATQIAARQAESEALTAAIDEARTYIARRDNQATLDFLGQRLRCCWQCPMTRPMTCLPSSTT